MADTQSIAGGQGPRPTTYQPLCATNFPIGTPVAQSISADGTVVPANAGSANTTYVVGLAAGAGVAGNRVPIQFQGPLTLDADQWDEITGGSGGLTRGVPYYLDTATGGITETAPVSSGDFFAPIGIATSATDLVILIALAVEIP